MEAAFCFSAFIGSPFVSTGYAITYLHQTTFLQLSLRPFYHSPTNNHGVEANNGGDELDDDSLMRLLIWSNEIQTMIFQLASLISNLCLCHDLISTLRTPFNVADARLNKYIAVTILFPLIVVFFIVWVNIVV